MQFAGQRTDLDFQPLGEPDNILVALADDTLPSPGAIMVTGITPQVTHENGLSERDFCQFFIQRIATPGTTIMGYNSVRFDDEFMRNTLWRNFYDPYEWQWKDGRSRWDLLDVVRLTRALRPEGIEWPVTADGRSTNRLELLTKLNGIAHEHAHDALADVVALIEVTKLIKAKQPQLFDFLYGLRGKRDVARLVNLQNPQPFVYASGRYTSEFEKTTVAYPLLTGRNDNVMVFNLRYNLDELLAAEKDGTFIEKFGTRWQKAHPEKARVDFFPIVKLLQYNHCPAVAPLGVLEKADGWSKIGLTRATIDRNLASLRAHPEFVERISKTILRRAEFPRALDPESALYDGFLDDHDRRLCSTVRNNDAGNLANYHPDFSDPRLAELLLHYKAKNYPSTLSADEVASWDQYRHARLERQAAKFIPELQKIKLDLNSGKTYAGKDASECVFLADELMLWYESLQPEDY